MERHGTPQPTREGWASMKTGNIDPKMHPATIAVKTARSAPNWEQLSGVVKKSNQRLSLDSCRCTIPLGSSWPMNTGRPPNESLNINLPTTIQTSVWMSRIQGDRSFQLRKCSISRSLFLGCSVDVLEGSASKMVLYSFFPIALMMYASWTAWRQSTTLRILANIVSASNCELKKLSMS